MSRSEKSYRILCEVYAKLIALFCDTGDARHRMAMQRHSLIKRATLIGTYARALTASLHRSKKDSLKPLDIKRAFQNGCYLEVRGVRQNRRPSNDSKRQRYNPKLTAMGRAKRNPTNAFSDQRLVVRVAIRRSLLHGKVSDKRTRWVGE